jgi:hypothetical protein
MRKILGWSLTIALSGCQLEKAEHTSLTTDVMRAKVDPQLLQANLEACTRVFTVGQKILAANPELPQRLLFRAVGRPNPEIFHQGNAAIVVTQRLVEMCRTESELAALLCVELGRLIAEREALAPWTARQPEPRPPIDAVQIRSTVGVANPDEFRLREQAHYEAEQRRRTSGAISLPDPMELARRYLQRSGYAVEDLDRIKPILKMAAEHSDLEQQMRSIPKAASFTPPGGAD